jgi:ribonuclease M5
MGKYQSVIVVEGKSDKDLIDSFLLADIVITNGSEVSRETIDYIKNLALKRTVVVLTDPDSPGKRIRDILDREIPGLLHAYIPKNRCIKKNKVGVAESSKEDILEALAHLVPAKKAPKGVLTMDDMFSLGLAGGDNSSFMRERVGAKLHLGYGNAKTLLRRANSLGISKKELQEAVRGK